MKGKTKKFLSVLLTMMMVCTASILPAMQGFAQDPAATLPKVETPTVTETTDTSITLGKPLVGDGKDTTDYAFEYSLNGGKFDKQNSFKQLTPDTVYAFRVRIAAGTYNGVVYKNAGAECSPLEVRTNKSDAVKEPTPQEPAAPQEPVTLQEPPATKEPVISQEPATPQGTETKGETTEESDKLLTNKEQTTKQEPDVQTEAKTEIKASGNTSTEPDKSAGQSSALPKQTKADTPKMKSRTDTGIVLEAVSGQEYAIKSTQGEKWQDSNEFTKLDPDTEYSFVTRIKATATDSAGISSDPASFRTKKAASAAPNAPVVKSATDSSITLEETENQEYAILTADHSEVWQDSGLFEGLKADTKYQFITRVKFNADEVMPSKNSDPTEGRTKKSAAKAPEIPVLQGRTDTTVTLITDAGQEYSLLTDQKAGTWQDSGTFTGLSPNTWYEFVSRNKFDPDKEAESTISPPLKVKTYISFNGAAIQGIEEGSTYYVGDTLNITAAGTSMDNSSPVAGDSRWRPVSWTWDGETYNNWGKDPYTIYAKLAKTGEFKLSVTYQLEEYGESGWTAVNSQEILQKNFKVDLRTYVITASAGKNGTISPNGKVEVKQGKYQTFKFTPNKGYRVAKVYVDGAEVKFKDNAYTFSDVSKDHKISVTFVKATTAKTPKTGDMGTNLLLWFLPLALAGAVITVILRKRRKQK